MDGVTGVKSANYLCPNSPSFPHSIIPASVMPAAAMIATPVAAAPTTMIITASIAAEPE